MFICTYAKPYVSLLNKYLKKNLRKMTDANFPCRKCKIECPINVDSICCDICLNWFHVTYSGLTYKLLCIDSTSVWYCQYCIQEYFPFGKLGK